MSTIVLGLSTLMGVSSVTVWDGVSEPVIRIIVLFTTNLRIISYLVPL